MSYSKKIKYSFMYMIGLAFLVACGGAENTTDQEKPATSVSSPKNKEKSLEARFELSVDGVSYRQEEFIVDKSRVELFKNGIRLIVSPPGTSRYVRIYLKGAYSDLPASFEHKKFLSTTDEELGASIEINNLDLENYRQYESNKINMLSGTATLEKADIDDLYFKVSFEGTGEYLYWNEGVTKTGEVPVTGSLEVKYPEDNLYDFRDK